MRSTFIFPGCGFDGLAMHCLCTNVQVCVRANEWKTEKSLKENHSISEEQQKNWKTLEKLFRKANANHTQFANSGLLPFNRLVECAIVEGIKWISFKQTHLQIMNCLPSIILFGIFHKQSTCSADLSPDCIRKSQIENRLIPLAFSFSIKRFLTVAHHENHREISQGCTQTLNETRIAHSKRKHFAEK